MTADIPKHREIIDNVSLSASAILQTFNRRILLVEQESDNWGLPAGGFTKSESGNLESPMEAILREIWEETGYKKGDLGLMKLEGVIILPSENKSDKYRLGFVYSASIMGDIDPNPQDEAIKSARYFEVGEVFRLINEKKIYKPRFNVGILIWWSRNMISDFTDTADTFDSKTIREFARQYGY